MLFVFILDLRLDVRESNKGQRLVQALFGELCSHVAGNIVARCVALVLP